MTGHNYPDDLSDLIAEVQCHFKALTTLTGEKWGWQHPKIAQWMRKKGFKSKHYLDRSAYESLARKLKATEQKELQIKLSTEQLELKL